MTPLDVARIVAKVVAPLSRRVKLTVGRAIINIVDDTKKAQSLQLTLLADETHDDVERFQEYGYTSVPPAGSEAIAVAVGGERSHLVVVATEHRASRPTDMLDGEVAMWTQQHGKRVHARQDGKLALGTEPTDAVAKAPPTEARLAALEAFAWGHTHNVSTSGNATTQTGTAAAQVGPSTLNTPSNPVAASEVLAK